MKPVPIPRFKTVYAQYSCPIKNAASLIGDKWILFIIREFLYGKEKQGFLELQRYLKPISSRTLAKKLKTLDYDIYIRTKYFNKLAQRARFHYGNICSFCRATTYCAKVKHSSKDNIGDKKKEFRDLYLICSICETEKDKPKNIFFQKEKGPLT